MDRRVMREPDGLGVLLRREAARERPVFSETLHARILRRLPVKPAAPAVVHRVEWRSAAWWPWSLAAAGAALVAVAIVTASPDPVEGPPWPVTVVTAEQAGGGAGRRWGRFRGRRGGRDRPLSDV